MPVTELLEIFECKYCKINLSNIGGASVGFVNCPQCLRSYLRMPQIATSENQVGLNPTRKKLLDLFVDPRQNEKALEDLKVSLKIQEEALEGLKAQRESLNLENLNTRRYLQDQLLKVQEDLEASFLEKQDLQLQVEETGFELKRLHELIAEKNQVISQLKKDLDSVSEKLNLREAFCETVEKENNLKTITLANVSNDASELKNLCVTYEKRIINLEDELAKEKNRINELNLSLHVIPDLEVELDKAKTTVRELQQSIELGAHEEIHEVNADQIALLNDEINALKIDIKDYTKTIAELQTQLESKNDVIRSKETEIISLTQPVVTEKSNAVEPNLFSAVEVDEIHRLRDRVRRLDQTEQKLEHVETELEISRDELSKAKKEIVAMNALLEKAFYENQKQQQVEIAPVREDQKLIAAARDIEKREEELMAYAYEMNNKIDAFVQQFSAFNALSYDIAAIRDDINGRVVQTIFEKDTILPVGINEIRKSITYKTTLNKGKVHYQQEDDRNLILNNFYLDFTSNTPFFLSESEYEALEVVEAEVEIREEYTLNSNGEISVCFYRNNGFKRFESRIGKIIFGPVKNIQKIQI